MRRRKDPRLLPSVLWPLLAALFLLAAVVGTDRLGRPLTDEEKRHFGALLREHDYPGCLLYTSTNIEAVPAASCWDATQVSSSHSTPTVARKPAWDYDWRDDAAA